MKSLFAALMVLAMPVMASADVIFGVTVRTAPPPVVYVPQTYVVPSPPVVYSVVPQPVTVQPLYIPSYQPTYIYTYPSYPTYVYPPYVYRPTYELRVEHRH